MKKINRTKKMMGLISVIVVIVIVILLFKSSRTDKVDINFNYSMSSKIIDVNLDGFDDIAIKTCEEMNGSECYRFYIYDNKKDLFSYSKDFSDIGFLPDFGTGKITKHLKDGCAGSCFTEEVYEVIDGKPILTNLINQSIDDENSTLIRAEKKKINDRWVYSTTTTDTD